MKQLVLVGEMMYLKVRYMRYIFIVRYKSEVQSEVHGRINNI